MVAKIEFLIGLFIGVLISVLVFVNRPKNEQKIINKIMPIIEAANESLGSLGDFGIRFPDVVLTQFILETGGGTSKIYSENNAWFGMKARKGESKKNGHAAYDNHIDSINAYKKWQDRMLKAYEDKFGPVKTDEEYIKFLGNLVIDKNSGKLYRYAEDLDYERKLRSILKTVREVRKYQKTQ